MARRLHLFVSVGPDLVAEREYIGQALASFPASLGWGIHYTPSAHEQAAPDPSPIVSSDFHVILLGVDITAPVGWELWTARRAGRVSIGFAKSVGRTPAAMVFYRESGVNWISFERPAELVSLLQEALAERLLEDPPRYGLTLSEWEALSAFLRREGKAEGRQIEGSGAGRGAVILAPGQDLPEGGVLVGQKAAKADR